jgi:hypothetical protein
MVWAEAWKEITMSSLTRIGLLGFATASAFVALGVAGPPARAEDFAQNLGPVGPHEPILTRVGNKRIIAFYEPGNGHCAINVVVWDNSDTDGNSAARVRVSLNPRQMVHIDSAENKSINLQCGDYAETLALVDTSKMIAAGTAE